LLAALFWGQPSVEQAIFAGAVAGASCPSNLVLSGPVLSYLISIFLYMQALLNLTLSESFSTLNFYVVFRNKMVMVMIAL